MIKCNFNKSFALAENPWHIWGEKPHSFLGSIVRMKIQNLIAMNKRQKQPDTKRNIIYKPKLPLTLFECKRIVCTAFTPAILLSWKWFRFHSVCWISRIFLPFGAKDTWKNANRSKRFTHVEVLIKPHKHAASASALCIYKSQFN